MVAATCDNKAPYEGECNHESDERKSQCFYNYSIWDQEGQNNIFKYLKLKSIQIPSNPNKNNRISKYK